MTENAKLQQHEAHWPCAEPDWTLFQDNQTIWNAVLEQCDTASRSIRLEQYIFGTSGVGRQLLDLLAAKARQGVDVRILADGLGSHGLVRCDGGQELLRSGGRIALFNPPGDLARRPFRRAHRLHRKTLICDESRVMVGGSCYEDRMSTWRDTMIRVGGPLPPAIVAEFDRASRMADNEPAEVLPTTDRGEQEGWSYALSGPDMQAQPDLRSALPGKIAGARHSVSLTTPYLIPNRRLWRAICSAVERGAKVRILMPARSDHRALDRVGQRFAHALVRRGVEVRGYTPAMIHAKVALVDGAWSSVSSFNLDVFSGNLNLESGIFSTSPALHEALSDQWETDWAQSEPF